MKTHGEAELRKSLEEMGNKTNVAIAAAVTAYSRMIINQYKLLALKLGLELFYSDTDSLVLNGALPPEHLDSATLGKLKLEHTFKEGIFVMPKVYYLELENGKTISDGKHLLYHHNKSFLVLNPDYVKNHILLIHHFLVEVVVESARF